MFRIPCPHCGLRNASEFRHVGESRERPEPDEATPMRWRAYLYERRNAADWTAETWYHGFGCRKFVGVERHTMTNEVRPATVPAGSAAVTAPSDSGAPDAESAR